MENLTTYGLALTQFSQLLVTMHFSCRSWMEQNCLGVLSMAGFLRITYPDPCYVLKPFYLFHYKYFIHHCIKSCKKKKIQKQWKERKEGRFWKQARYSPIPKREINLKVCKLKCHSWKTHFYLFKIFNID